LAFSLLLTLSARQGAAGVSTILVSLAEIRFLAALMVWGSLAVPTVAMAEAKALMSSLHCCPLSYLFLLWQMSNLTESHFKHQFLHPCLLVELFLFEKTKRGDGAKITYMYY
jgi:hypothetical protein